MLAREQGERGVLQNARTFSLVLSLVLSQALGKPCASSCFLFPSSPSLQSSFFEGMMPSYLSLSLSLFDVLFASPFLSSLAFLFIPLPFPTKNPSKNERNKRIANEKEKKRRSSLAEAEGSAPFPPCISRSPYKSVSLPLLSLRITLFVAE